MKVHSSLIRRSTPFFAALAMGAVTLAAPTIGAQQTQSSIELRPFVGAFVPTGDQADLLKTSVLAGAEIGWQFQPNLAVTGAFAWAPSKDKTLVGDESVDLYQYDVALEGRLNNLTAGSSWSTRPYARLGAGARTYNYRNLDNVSAQTDFVGHGAIGLDVAPNASRLGLRVEARDNVSSFRGLQGELASRETRNDMQFTAGLTIRM